MSEDKKRSLSFIETLAIAFGVVFVAWYFGPLFIETFLGQFWGHNMGGNFRNPDKERFGPEESFAAMNTLFSGLAFAAVAVSLWHQRRDLLIQAKALNLQIRQERISEAEREIQTRVLALPHLELVTEYSDNQIQYWVENKGAEAFEIKIFREGDDFFYFFIYPYLERNGVSSKFKCTGEIKFPLVLTLTYRTVYEPEPREVGPFTLPSGAERLLMNLRTDEAEDIRKSVYQARGLKAVAKEITDAESA